MEVAIAIDLRDRESVPWGVVLSQIRGKATTGAGKTCRASTAVTSSGAVATVVTCIHRFQRQWYGRRTLILLANVCYGSIMEQGTIPAIHECHPMAASTLASLTSDTPSGPVGPGQTAILYMDSGDAPLFVAYYLKARAYKAIIDDDVVVETNDLPIKHPEAFFREEIVRYMPAHVSKKAVEEFNATWNSMTNEEKKHAEAHAVRNARNFLRARAKWPGNHFIEGSALPIMLTDSVSGRDPNLRRGNPLDPSFGILCEGDFIHCVDWRPFASVNNQQLGLTFFNNSQFPVHIFVTLLGIPAAPDFSGGDLVSWSGDSPDSTDWQCRDAPVDNPSGKSKS